MGEDREQPDPSTRKTSERTAWSGVGLDIGDSPERVAALVNRRIGELDLDLGRYLLAPPILFS